jgi:hypothetical protein
MDEILEGWADLLTDPRLPEALNGGYDAVVHLLAESLDEWMQTGIPAYAAAVNMCSSIPVTTAFDCDKERERVRDNILKQLLEVTRLKWVIEQTLAQWRRVPPSIRQFAIAAVSDAQRIDALYNDPSTANFLQQAKTDSVLVKQYLNPALEEIWNGAVPRSPVTQYLYMALTTDPSQVQSVLTQWGMSTTEGTKEYLSNGLSTYLGSESARVFETIVDTSINPVSSAKGVWDYATGLLT